MGIPLHQEESILDNFSRLNWKLISLIVLISCIGFVMLYSAARGSLHPWSFRQILYFIAFFPMMIAIALVDIRVWFRFSYLAYGAALILLIIVAVTGYKSMGATRWIRIGGFNIQPSETMKICLIMALAKYFHTISLDETEKLHYLIIPIVMIAAPVFLILKQPDLGTSIILLVVGVTLLFVSGVKMWKFVTSGILGLVSIPFIWQFLLHDYQKQRILTFLNPGNDPLDSGYNIIQSKIAIGSGGFTGKGILNGTQGQLDFLPERQTDFIFTMLAEEFGFIGGFVTISLYAAIIAIATFIALKARHQYGRLIAMGVATLFFFHMFVNIAMVMGMMPVVGAPLPLISYGGTITVTMLISFGLLLNVDLYCEKEIKD